MVLLIRALYRGVKENGGKVISVFPKHYSDFLTKIESDEIIETDTATDQLKYLVNKGKLSKFEKIIMIMQEKSKKKILEIAKGEEDLKMMVRKIEELSEDPEILGLYDKEKVDKLVFNINMEQCRRESTAQGLAEGKAKGLSEGLAQGKIETAKNMLKKEMNINLISEITGLSKEEIETLK